MDPYLENPVLWPGFHLGLIADLQAELNRQLRPKYIARVEERIYVSDENDTGRLVMIPDLRVFPHESNAGVQRPNKSAGSSTSVIEPIEVTTFLDDEIHEARLEVIDTEYRSVVTVIEILSPTNKVQGSRGQESYQKKRAEVMRSPSHLVEIDLLRAGAGIFIPDPIPPHEYLVHVSRAKANGGRRATVWPIPVTKPLPTIPIPLRGKDPDAMVDLQKVFATAYERGAYDVDLDYTRGAIPPLPAEHAEWAQRTIASVNQGK
jgi:hypothetical protein